LSTKLQIISPADGSLYHIGRFASDTEAQAALASARSAAANWKQTSVEQRIASVDAFVDALIGQREALAAMTAWQVGRPLAKSDETDDLRYLYDHYKTTLIAGLGVIDLPGSNGERRFARREPYGVNLSICAWNYPVVMLSSLILAPLLTGNVVIFKHAPQTARISEVINEACRVAGLPFGVLQALDLTNAQCAAMLGSGDIDLVNFVGSSRGGMEVRQAAASQLVGEIFELGGKDAAYVRADANLEVTASELARAAFTNSGQSCCSVERIYVTDAVHDRFVDLFVDAASMWRVGHPVEDDFELGPVISAAAAQRIENEVAQAIRGGARELLGRPVPDLANPAAYVAPKILVDVDHAMPIMRAETFGPVAPIMRVRSDEEAIRLINDSDYGLTASVWTSDLDAGLALGHTIDTGNFYVNQADFVDEYLPWGGVRASGLGRTDGFSWIESLTQVKGFYSRRLPG
jgi:acyl-CoA reductase-like NAD-dependent aldehyde dehydrogenase